MTEIVNEKETINTNKVVKKESTLPETILCAVGVGVATLLTVVFVYNIRAVQSGGFDILYLFFSFPAYAILSVILLFFSAPSFFSSSSVISKKVNRTKRNIWLTVISGILFVYPLILFTIFVLVSAYC